MAKGLLHLQAVGQLETAPRNLRQRPIRDDGQ